MKTRSKYPANGIRAIRESRDLTQEALAEKIGTTNQQIGRLENGERRLTWEWMQRIASALECHPMDLVEPNNQPPSEEEKQLLARYRMLADTERQTLSSMADYLAEKSASEFKPRSED